MGTGDWGRGRGEGSGESRCDQRDEKTHTVRVRTKCPTCER